jgi:uncharacterized membrane protein
MKFAWSKLSVWHRHLIIALVYSNAVSILLFCLRVVGAENFRYWFLLWNLLLALVPLVPAYLLSRRLKSTAWTEPWNVLLTALWLAVLPNSFYVLSDLIHLHATGEINLLFDAVMFYSFIFNAFVSGFLSVYLLHQQLLIRLSSARAHAVIGLVFVLCGFAVYLGRSLRWNSWDLLIHPLAVLFDISDGIVNPVAHPQLIVTTSIFFLLLSSIYAVIWQGIALVKADARRR